MPTTQTELDSGAAIADAAPARADAVPVIDGAAEAPSTSPEDEDSDLVEDELLVEEISIDGMCGVY